jgi:hypothetical protein
MKLFYDPRDRVAARHGDKRLQWLFELGAKPIEEARPEDEGFLFAGARGLEDYRALVSRLPKLRDRPEERAPLLELDDVLDALEAAKVSVPTPRTWRIDLDDPIPKELRYPLFVRSDRSSWKLGGQISKVRNEAELVAEMQALRRAIQWDARILRPRRQRRLRQVSAGNPHVDHRRPPLRLVVPLPPGALDACRVPAEEGRPRPPPGLREGGRDRIPFQGRGRRLRPTPSWRLDLHRGRARQLRRHRPRGSLPGGRAKARRKVVGGSRGRRRRPLLSRSSAALAGFERTYARQPLHRLRPEGSSRLGGAGRNDPGHERLRLIAPKLIRGHPGCA